MSLKGKFIIKEKGSVINILHQRQKVYKGAASLIFEVLNERVIDFMFKTDSVLS